MGNKPTKVTDLTAIEPDHVDGSDGAPIRRIGIVIEGDALLVQVPATLGTASFTYFVFEVPGMTSLLLATAVVIALSQPKLASKLLKQAGRVTGKLKK